jgi:hypothetical protein
MPRLARPIRSAIAPMGGLSNAMAIPAIAIIKLHSALPVVGSGAIALAK